MRGTMMINCRPLHSQVLSGIVGIVGAVSSPKEIRRAGVMGLVSLRLRAVHEDGWEFQSQRRGYPMPRDR